MCPVQMKWQVLDIRVGRVKVKREVQSWWRVTMKMPPWGKPVCVTSRWTRHDACTMQICMYYGESFILYLHRACIILSINMYVWGHAHRFTPRRHLTDMYHHCMHWLHTHRHTLMLWVHTWTAQAIFCCQAFSLRSPPLHHKGREHTIEANVTCYPAAFWV